MTDKTNEYPISPDTEQFISERPEAKVVHVPRIGEQPKSDAPKHDPQLAYCPCDSCLAPAAPLQAERMSAREFILKCCTPDEWNVAQIDLATVAKIAESYSSHVSSELLKSVVWWKKHAELALKERDAAQEFAKDSDNGKWGRMKVAENREDELRKELACVRKTSVELVESAEARISELERERDEARSSAAIPISMLYRLATHAKPGFEGQSATWKWEEAECVTWERIDQATDAESQLSTLREALSDIAEAWTKITWTANLEKGAISDFTGTADRCDIQSIERALTPPTGEQK